MADGTLEETKSMEEETAKDKEELEVTESQEKKQVEEEEKSEEGEGEAGEEEEEEDGEKKASKKSTPRGIRSKKSSQESDDVKEPVTPGSERPTRERKVVDRYSAPSVSRSSTKPVSIEKGRGTQLKDIPNVAFKLSKRKTDDTLQMLHTLLFGKKGKAHTIKRNIGQFSGFVWVENEQEKQKAKAKEKIDKYVKEKLFEFCDILNIPASKTAKKEDLSVKLLEFLESPHSTTDVLLAEKEQSTKKRKVTPNKNVTTGDSSGSPKKKRKQTPKSGEKEKQVLEADVEDNEKDESADIKGDHHENEVYTTANEESDHEKSKSVDDEDKPEVKSKKGSSKKIVKESSESKSKDKSTPRKKTEPAKASEKPARKSSGKKSKQGSTDPDETPKESVSKKKKVDKEKKQTVDKESLQDSKEKVSGKKQPSKSQKVSADEKGKGKSSKKPKPQPTREEMHAVVVNILKEVDFNTATLSDILRQLGEHFSVDLMNRKSEVKEIITEVINNMSDEEEGEESEGGDDDKDDDDA